MNNRYKDYNSTIYAEDSTYNEYDDTVEYYVTRVDLEINIDGYVDDYQYDMQVGIFENEDEAISVAEDWSKDNVYPEVGFVVTEGDNVYDGKVIWSDYPIGSYYGEVEHYDMDRISALIDAMEAAGYYYDEFECGTPSEYQKDIRFDAEYSGGVYFDSWDDVYDWLNGVVFDDPEVSDEVDRILNSYE